jgi:flagellar hook-basal body complex protein FliE
MVDSTKMLSAMNAYSTNLQNISKSSTALMPISSDGGQANESAFSSMVGNSIETAATTIKAGETMAMKGLVDEASLAEVATAVADAELTLKTVVAVRDRIISAYQDIIKMPI